MLGLLTSDRRQDNLIAQGINEYFIDRGHDHPVAYAEQPYPWPAAPAVLRPGAREDPSHE